jgi:hypothetical protein
MDFSAPWSGHNWQKPFILKGGENEDRNEDWKDTDDSGGIFDALFLISFSSG